MTFNNATTPDSVNDQQQPLRAIVGIGASAGGLEALQQLFDKLPPDTDLAFVVVQHLSPDFKSLMDEILRRHTAMAVHRVTDGMKVEANSVYFIPPKMEMIISDGKLLLTEKDYTQALSLPIDHFFRSLAQEACWQSVAIVLSGTGSDGSRGIRDVHAAGGLVIAQDTESAKFDGMPKSAVETDVVDLVLSPAAMAEALFAVRRPSATATQRINARRRTRSKTNPEPVERCSQAGFQSLQTSHGDAAHRTSLATQTHQQR